MDKLVPQPAIYREKRAKRNQGTASCTVTINGIVSPPLSPPSPLTGVTGVWHDRIHEGSVATFMLFVCSLDSHLTRLKIAPPQPGHVLSLG